MLILVIKIMTKLQKQVFPSNLNENILRFWISVKNYDTQWIRSLLGLHGSFQN